MRVRFSPDGRWLVQVEYLLAHDGKGHLSIITDNGSSESLEDAHPEASAISLSEITETGHFVSYLWGGHILWSGSKRRRVAGIQYERPAYTLGIAQHTNRDRHVLLVVENNLALVDTLRYDGSVGRIGTLEMQYSTPRAIFRRFPYSQVTFLICMSGP